MPHPPLYSPIYHAPSFTSLTLLCAPVFHRRPSGVGRVGEPLLLEGCSPQSGIVRSVGNCVIFKCVFFSCGSAMVCIVCELANSAGVMNSFLLVSVGLSEFSSDVDY